MDDLVVEFLTETNEGLQALDLDLVNLEKNPNDKGLLSKIFRLMHTIKGTCGFIGLPRLETVAHRAENVLGRFRDGDLEVTPAYVTLILESIDRIKFIVSTIEEKGKEPEGDDNDLTAKLDAVYEGRDAGAASAPVEKSLEQEANLEEIFRNTPVAPSAPSVEAPRAEAPQAEKIPDRGDAKESALAAQTLRVNVDTLENLMTTVSELVLTRNQLLQILRLNTNSDFGGPLQRLNHVVSDLQEGVMKTRMQPIGNAWAKLPRIIRDLSIELGKKIDLEMHGQDTELDRQVLELIKDPLTHMVRNSGDHGIEDPETRRKAGKPETGKVILKAYHEGGHIIIVIQDDGKGLPLEKIKKKLIEKGLASEAEVAQMTPQQIQQFIFNAGFSTADKVTSVSGRGVGMDVVRTNIEKIGGSIELKSVEGKGSTFTIKIPLTLAIVSALIVEASGERFAIPQICVRELVMTSERQENRIETIKGTPVFRLRNRILPLVSLSEMLKLGGEKTADQQAFRYIVVTQIGTYSFGIIVDRVYDTEEIVVKPVAKILRNLELFSGNTILGDGRVIMILDPNGIAKATGDATGQNREDTAAQEEEHVADSRQKTALLLFRAGNGTPKAVPLSLIARLESINLAKVEHSGGMMMIQYRGGLMPLSPLNPSDPVGTEGTAPVLVFSDRERSLGMIVAEIIDIREDYINIENGSTQPGLLGSTIIEGKATEIVDATSFLMRFDSNWFKNHDDQAYAKGTNGKARRRVLLVDDSAFFRNMLTPLLSVAGYDVTSLDSPLQALEMREKGTCFDIIVSDIEMPEMDGFEFAEKVRGGGNWKGTPMVALSSHATQKDIDRGMEVGFTRYVAKFDRDVLLATLSETLSDSMRKRA